MYELSFLFQVINVSTISSFICVTFTLSIFCSHINILYKGAKFMETNENSTSYALTHSPSKL